MQKGMESWHPGFNSQDDKEMRVTLKAKGRSKCLSRQTLRPFLISSLNRKNPAGSANCSGIFYNKQKSRENRIRCFQCALFCQLDYTVNGGRTRTDMRAFSIEVTVPCTAAFFHYILFSFLCPANIAGRILLHRPPHHMASSSTYFR